MFASPILFETSWFRPICAGSVRDDLILYLDFHSSFLSFEFFSCQGFEPEVLPTFNGPGLCRLAVVGLMLASPILAC
jgi:hypothetical protein